MLPRSLANFVGSVVCFLNVLAIRLRSLLLAALLSFEIEMVSIQHLTISSFSMFTIYMSSQ